MLHDARRRVSRGVLTDFLFWVLISLTVVAGVRALNDGVAMRYDAEIARWTIASPCLPNLPGSVAGSGLEHFALAVALTVVITGCRHALGRSARFAFLLISSALAGIVSLITVLLIYDRPGEIMHLAECGFDNPFYVGCVYGVFLLISLIAVTAVFEKRWWVVMPLVFVALGGNASATFMFAPPYVAALFAGAAVILLVYSFIYLRLKVGSFSEFKSLVVIGLSMACAGMIAIAVLPDEALMHKIAPYNNGDFFSAGLESVRNALTRVSLNIWKQSPWLGFGLGSFPIALRFNAATVDWSIFSASQIAPLNGYLLLLSERGVIGAFFLVVPLVVMQIGYCYRLVSGIKKLPHPLAWLAPIALIVVALETLFDCSFLAPSALLPMFAIFQLSANAFPKEKSTHGK